MNQLLERINQALCETDKKDWRPARKGVVSLHQMKPSDPGYDPGYEYDMRGSVQHFRYKMTSGSLTYEDGFCARVGDMCTVLQSGREGYGVCWDHDPNKENRGLDRRCLYDTTGHSSYYPGSK